MEPGEEGLKKSSITEFLCVCDLTFSIGLQTQAECRGQLRHCKQGDVFWWRVGSMG